MIHKKTVFILGAGASIPYGFPSGLDLRNLLVEHAEREQSQLAINLQHLLKIDQGEVQNFLKTFQRSNIVSIDTFLARRQNFSEIGKLAIAYEICAREVEQVVFRRNNDDHWYELLWGKLLADVETPQQLSNNNVRFITFNYDRSLEFFLYESTRHSLELSGDAAMKLAGSLPILHVYGMLGRFHYAPAEDARQYTNALDARQLKTAAGGIKIIPEARLDDRVFQDAKDWMSWAEQIIFLGFGFDTLNVQRLGLSDILESINKAGRSLPIVYATAIGMTQAEINSASAMVCGRFGWQVSQNNNRNRMALRTWGNLV